MKTERTTNLAPCCKEAAQASTPNCDYNGRNSSTARYAQCPGGQSVQMLSDLKIGESGLLVDLDLPAAVQNHLMHMGFVPEARVKVLRKAPAGDPIVYGVDGMEIALRRETASAIRVHSCEDETAAGEAAQ